MNVDSVARTLELVWHEMQLAIFRGRTLNFAYDVALRTPLEANAAGHRPLDNANPHPPVSKGASGKDCFDWMAGRCTRGKSCSYMHADKFSRQRSRSPDRDDRYRRDRDDRYYDDRGRDRDRDRDSGRDRDRDRDRRR